MLGKIVAAPRTLVYFSQRLTDRLAHFAYGGFGQRLPIAAQLCGDGLQEGGMVIARVTSPIRKGGDGGIEPVVHFAFGQVRESFQRLSRRGIDRQNLRWHGPTRAPAAPRKFESARPGASTSAQRAGCRPA